MEQEQGKIFYDLMKVYLAQMDSALKISNIIYEHSDREEGLTGGDIICGLIYRLMIPMTKEEIEESLSNAGNILDTECSESEEEKQEDKLDDKLDYDSIEEQYEKPKISHKIKSNQCNCEICSQVRVCLLNYKSFEPGDQLAQKFKDSIEHTCSEHKIYI